MLLSVCILMKGDADALRRLAAMVRTLADELVIVCDDPVAENFQAAAAQCNARLVPHRWQNDFSAARNAGLAAARGEWVFWIDSDETLLAPAAPDLRRLLQRPEMLGYYVTIEDQTGPATRTPRQHPCLYRRRADLRYHGRIHEHFQPPLEIFAARHGLKFTASPVRLTHTGYEPEKRLQKLQRNIPLLELELADRPGQLYYLIELGRSLLLSGQPRGHAVLAEAAQILAPTLPQDSCPIPLVAALLEYALQHAPADFPLNRAAAAAAALRWFPTSAPLIWLIARWQYTQGNIAEAAKHLRAVLDLGEKKTYDATVSFDQRIFGDETRLNYGVCCAKLGQLGQARAQFKRIKPGSPFHAAAQENLRHLAPA
ncbi:MAG: glycosyltransferase [Verrucomicrobiae bacterium]|nr:glycosyltransferase [Verrucomicrobiae bacterium]